ncbi:hypothetical protein [Phaeobacter porticola]|uniref:Uncharacterized protein n=1 Tax=Phaeobacter porticola TaxID=1844006 RepID=A0A1L3I618_9RHOB|nr:hypothetical protein [Phaeobacter porticola]APG47517.1 hypothetical protein PhaeoP97_02117 [Phaeobacter porticola]
MDIMLHIGAHRCATGYFQAFLAHHAAALGRDGWAIWGPDQTRDGLFHGVQPGPVSVTGRNLVARARGRLQLRLAAEQAGGSKQLLISDADLMGSPRNILSQRQLYGGVGVRMARFDAAFDGQVRDVMLNLRSPERFWTSLLTQSVAKGNPLPSADLLGQIAAQPRSWRDVITDVACAMPNARIWVMPYETYGDRPEVQLALLTGTRLARLSHADRLNRSDGLPTLRHRLAPNVARDLPRGEGRWSPFSDIQSATLRERYADDLMWLHGGADGLAELMRDPDKHAVGSNPPPYDLTRGTSDDDQNRRLAGSG